MSASEILTLRLPVATQRRLAKLAKSTDRTRSRLAAEAIEKFLDDNEWQIEAIEEGLRSADAGDLHAHDDVMAWVKSWGTKRELKRPK